MNQRLYFWYQNSNGLNWRIKVVENSKQEHFVCTHIMNNHAAINRFKYVVLWMCDTCRVKRFFLFSQLVIFPIYFNFKFHSSDSVAIEKKK